MLQQQSIPVPASYVQQKALEIAVDLDLLDFKGGYGWYEGFAKRFSLITTTLYDRDVDKDNPSLLKALDAFTRGFK